MSQAKPEELFLLLNPQQQLEVINARNSGLVSEEVYGVMTRAGARGWRWETNGNPPSFHMSREFRDWLRDTHRWVESLTEEDKAAFAVADDTGKLAPELHAKLSACPLWSPSGCQATPRRSGWSTGRTPLSCAASSARLSSSPISCSDRAVRGRAVAASARKLGHSSQQHLEHLGSLCVIQLRPLLHDPLRQAYRRVDGGSAGARDGRALFLGERLGPRSTASAGHPGPRLVGHLSSWHRPTVVHC